MPKSHETHRAMKKKPLMTAKQKRMAKHAKKHPPEMQMMPPPTTH